MHKSVPQDTVFNNTRISSSMKKIRPQREFSRDALPLFRGQGAAGGGFRVGDGEYWGEGVGSFSVLATLTDSFTQTLFYSTVTLMALMTERYDPTDTEESEIEEPLPPRSHLVIETNTTVVQPAQDVRRTQDENNDSDSQEQEIIHTRAGYFAMNFYILIVATGFIDIINKFFDQFGKNIIDWPHRDCCNIRAPPNGFVFVIFNRESAVHRLINATEVRHGKRLIVMKNDDMVIKTVSSVYDIFRLMLPFLGI
ncbi:hypothetical protein X798_02506 [Onchocerca flexuosa]|uniref:RRM domain-containing protein n=1 Tax=Onchocerca flexuosa TaxID=387005 RepID=A0A238BYX9_9BILA|nr:hypothetical protein X798_02506 [Onchocerca flexuosa]